VSSLQFDHVAIGVVDASFPLKVLTERFGGTVLGGGAPPGAGFRAMQVHLGEPDSPGMTIELLEPYAPEANDFLARFVERHGDGPHHMTFKTDDIAGELVRLRSLGVEPIGVNFSNTVWQEMFIHPKVAHGVVVQIAQTPHGLVEPATLVASRREHGSEVFEGSGWWGPVERGEGPAWLRRVVLGSPTPAETAEFYCTILQGHDAGDQRVTWTGGELAVVQAPVPGVLRFELEGDHQPVEIAGTYFSFS
jgi:hypothetical protein